MTEKLSNQQTMLYGTLQSGETTLPFTSLSPAQRVGIFVLGMHRSGTSAMTRVINILGVPTNSPDDRKDPAPGVNEKGFWESAALVTFNNELLAFLGCDIWCPPKPPFGWERVPSLQPFRTRAGSAFKSVFRTPQWVWKDPRNCITFPFWVHVLDVRPIVVLTYRNPLEVSRSLSLVMGFSKRHGLALWERYIRETLANVVNLPVVITSYKDLLEDTSLWCERTQSFLTSGGVILNEDYSLEEVSIFLEEELWHNRSTPSNVLGDPNISESQARLFATLEESRGMYDTFKLPELPPETFSTEALLAERRGRLPR